MNLKLNHKIFPILSEIVSNQHLEAYVVGGFVRDLLLNRPSKDIDIVVVGSGIDLAEKTAKKIGKNCKVTVFKTFGTAQIVFGDEVIEFVGARKESYQRTSRKPMVENGTLDEDQKRRDFTINALAINLSAEHYGELVDPFNGISDLDNKLIRTPLEPLQTFSDDPLRMIRAIRFATQLQFTIVPETFQAIIDNVYRLEIVSQERIVDELHKILLSPKPSIGFELLDQSGLLQYILPEMILLKGVESVNGRKHKDNFIHTLKVLDNVAQTSDNLWLRWAALLHDIAKPQTKRFNDNNWTFHSHEVIGSKMVVSIFKRLRLPLNEKMKYVQKMVLLHLRPIVLAEDEVTDSALRRLLNDANDDIEDLMLLCEADITSSIEEKVKSYLQNFQYVRQSLKDLVARDAIRTFQPVLRGEDIIRIYEISPSKIIGDIKTEIKNAILDGKIENTYDECVKLMLEIGKKMGLEPKNL